VSDACRSTSVLKAYGFVATTAVGTEESSMEIKVLGTAAEKFFEGRGISV